MVCFLLELEFSDIGRSVLQRFHCTIAVLIKLHIDVVSVGLVVSCDALHQFSVSVQILWF